MMADLQPPKAHWKDAIRTGLEKYVEAEIPFYGSLFTYAGRIFNPSVLEEQTKSWQGEVSRRINNLEKSANKLSRSIRISELALMIGSYISKESQDGYVEPFDVYKITTRFQEHTEEQIIEACGELENAGVCTHHQLANSSGYLTINVEFFFVFDPFVHSWHPSLDAATLSRKIIEVTAKNEAAVSSIIADELGWGPRRYNPPLQMIVTYISDSRVGHGYTPPWVHRYVYTSAAERTRLRELAHEMDGL